MSGRLMLAGVAIATIVAGCALNSELSRDDHGSAQDRRERVVELIRTGQLREHNEYGDVVLPPDFEGASKDGIVTVRDAPFMVFFMTWTGFSPDPYCGYEYAPDEGSVDPDPLASGSGNRLEQIAPGWYWICAS